MPSRRFGVAIAAAAALLLGALPANASSTDPDNRRTMKVDLAQRLTDAKPQPPQTLGSMSVNKPAADCSTVEANMAEYAKAGVQEVLCSSTSADIGRVPTSGSSVQAGWCDDLDRLKWWVTRSALCLHGYYIYWKTQQVPSGLVTGWATFDVSHEVELFPRNLETEETSAVKLIESWGRLASPVVTYTAKCSSPCATVDGEGLTAEQFSLGETNDAFYLYRSDPAGSKTFFNTSYSFFVHPPPNHVPVGGPVEWTTPSRVFRCDDLVSDFRGCVIPAFLPELQVTVTEHKAAAMGILFAQDYLPDSWGYKVPVSRLANDAEAEANRRKICEDGTFVPQPDVTDDSCDEYAFARTRESGGYLGLTGKDCAEIVPFFENGEWRFDLMQYTGQERCLRAHVPLPENRAVGSKLGGMTNEMRLIDEDQYWVGVYN